MSEDFAESSRAPLTHLEVEAENGWLSALQADAEAFLRQAASARYAHAAGLTPTLDMASLYQRFSTLIRPSTFERLNRFSRPPDSRLAEKLRAFVATQVVCASSRALRDRLAQEEATAHADVAPGYTLPFQRLGAAIRTERSRERRGLLEAAQLRTVDGWESLLARILEAEQKAAASLGYTTLEELCADVYGVDFAALEQEGEHLLADTDNLYAEHLRWWLRRDVGIRVEDALGHDIAFVLHGATLDHVFPRERLVASARAWAEGVQIDLTAGGRIEMDLTPREAKTPRAFCAAIDVPGRVIISLHPSGGYGHYSAFYHELGHALYLTSMSPSQPWEERRLGDRTVGEAHAETIASILLSPEWLFRDLDLRTPRDVVRFAAFRRLATARRLVAQLAFERRLYSASRASAEEYANRLAAATHVKPSPTLWLYDRAPLLYSGVYLRSFFLAAAVSRVLSERFGSAWPLEREATDALRGVWRTGCALRGEELATELGQQLDRTALVAQAFDLMG
jgi:hypothetical protein